VLPRVIANGVALDLRAQPLLVLQHLPRTGAESTVIEVGHIGIEGSVVAQAVVHRWGIAVSETVSGTLAARQCGRSGQCIAGACRAPRGAGHRPAGGRSRAAVSVPGSRAPRSPGW
jgi:hypothetical protein